MSQSLEALATRDNEQMTEPEWRLSKSKRKRLVWAWLEENCGADGWAMTSSGSRGVLNDACRSISPMLLWRACSPLGWWRGRQRRAGRSTACPRAILHSRPGAADCRRSRQVGRQATKPRNEAYLARNRKMLWGGRRRKWQLRRCIFSMECRDAPAKRPEQIPRHPGPE